MLHDSIFDEVPELDALLKLSESIEWGPPINMPYLANPLQASGSFPIIVISMHHRAPLLVALAPLL